MPGRALMGSVLLAAAGTVTVGLLAGLSAGDDQWDLPMSPINRPVDIPLDHPDLCADLGADQISLGCRLMAESGTAEIVVIPQFDESLRDGYGPVVNGTTNRWIGISRFPAIQIAAPGNDGYATCRIALDVAPTEVLLVVYRREAADPKLPPCAPARDFANRAIRSLESAKQ
ncbi:hypothetical protein [Actinocrispum wychmicini]|uniref:DUF3558 domain-containing protein n=1 Tax=Actinocrispum wychmicini TaxID=1213861 RepID=A0A4R2JY10_9PSEU|nr:hypothetical protein [Actinocrispum wychmicini]TCO64764.1 hypothetical protein EV192_101546 [Actinocrispum wychmicini]